MQGRPSASKMCLPLAMGMESAHHDEKKRNTTVSANETDTSWYMTPPSSSDCFLSKKTSRLRKVSDSVVVCQRGKMRFDGDDGKHKSSYRDMFQKVDILKELYKKSMVGTVCKNILNRLSEKDLLRYVVYLTCRHKFEFGLFIPVWLKVHILRFLVGGFIFPRFCFGE